MSIGPSIVNASSLGAGGAAASSFFNCSPAYIGAGTVIGRALNSTEIANLYAWIKAKHRL